jgi:hypothetical protein
LIKSDVLLSLIASYEAIAITRTCAAMVTKVVAIVPHVAAHYGHVEEASLCLDLVVCYCSQVEVALQSMGVA